MFKQVFRGPLSETATVASQLGTPGEARMDGNGNIYKLLQVGSISLEPWAAVALQSTQPLVAGGGAYVVIPASVVQRGAHAFANQVSVSHQTGVYFWGQQYGVGSVKQTGVIPLGGFGWVSVSGWLSSSGGVSDMAVFKMLSSATTAAGPVVGFINCLGGVGG